MKTVLNRRRPGLWAAATLACVAFACSSQGPASPSPRQPLPESRAREVIAQAIHESGARPQSRFYITVKRGKQLEVDVGVVGHRYGVTYVTGSERETLGDAIPAYDVGSSSLRLLRDLKQRDMAVLLLHDLGYVADEELGADRERTAIAAELKLARDVKDFLAKAQGENWP
jgi:hypothetical protein